MVVRRQLYSGFLTELEITVFHEIPRFEINKLLENGMRIRSRLDSLNITTYFDSALITDLRVRYRNPWAKRSVLGKTNNLEGGSARPYRDSGCGAKRSVLGKTDDNRAKHAVPGWQNGRNWSKNMVMILFDIGDFLQYNIHISQTLSPKNCLSQMLD